MPRWFWIQFLKSGASAEKRCDLALRRMLSWMKLEEKSDLAVQNQDYREEKLWSKRFGFFFSKPNHSSAPAAHSRGKQIHSPAFLEQARIQSSVVLGTPPLSWSENFLDQRTVESRKAASFRSTNDLFAFSGVNHDEEEKDQASELPCCLLLSETAHPSRRFSHELWFGFEKKKPNLFDHNFSSR